MNYGPGTIITPCADLARYTAFQVSMMSLQVPPGSRWVPAIGLSTVDQLNTAIRSLRPEDEWIWTIGDDHTFAPETLLLLLERDVDVIAPLCCQRKPPWPLVHYTKEDVLPGMFTYLQYDELPDDGEPFEIYRTGSAMLIKRHVLEALGDPWFDTSPDLLNEDLDFTGRVRELGFKVWLDPSVIIGHIGQVVVQPMMKDGVWGLDIGYPGIAETHQFLPGGMDINDNLGEVHNAEEPVPA